MPSCWNLRLCKWKLMISETRMDRENKAVKIRSGSPQKTQQNLILSFLAPPYRLAWPRSCWINYPERAMQSRLSCSLPHYRHYSPPRSSASERFLPPPVEQVCDWRRNKWHRTGRLLARAGYVSPVASHVFMVYVLLCWGVFFLFSHCTPQWSIVWG